LLLEIKKLCRNPLTPTHVKACSFSIQAFLFAFITERYTWLPLPTGINLVPAHYASDKRFLEQILPRATLVHFVGPAEIKTMVGRVSISEDGTRVIEATSGNRYEFWGVLDVAWNDAWEETRHRLELPVQEWHPPASDMVVEDDLAGSSIPQKVMTSNVNSHLLSS
jgi:hypothetical protein